MRVVATADLHGVLPDDVPPCDLLVIAGDVCPFGEAREQRKWLKRDFRAWVAELDTAQICWVAGNHDHALEQVGERNPMPGTTYLQDSGVITSSAGELFRIWGTPWTQGLPVAWAFGLPERAPLGPSLERVWDAIPDSTDILITHEAPQMVLDRTKYGDHAGSRSLRRRVNEIRPRLHIFGHIHEAAGVRVAAGTTFVNACGRLEVIDL